MELLFPYKEVRRIQDELIKEISNCIRFKKHLIAHAPTGLGKTAAVFSSCLPYALENGLTIFFLTSRHTQHIIALDTLRHIKEKFGTDLVSVDIIGKQWMCPVPEADKLFSHDFYEFCKLQREENKCEYYLNVCRKSGRPTMKAMQILGQIKERSPCHCEDITAMCADEKLCPYEMSVLLAKEANVVVADYYYIFHPSIRNTFFKKADKELSKSIIIVDEGHNLPSRARELLTSRISNFAVRRAIKEAKKFGYVEIAEDLISLQGILWGFAQQIKKDEEEMLVKKEEFVSKVNEIKDYDEFISELILIGDEIREKKKQSYVGGIGRFLEAWLGQDYGFTRIISKKETERGNEMITVSYRCLDPSFLTKEVIEQSHSIILMSGTLTPTAMYHEILGFNPLTVSKEFDSPFPKGNKLSLIVPETTTRYAMRSEEQYQNIAKAVSQITNSIPGNCAVFFPSYKVRDDVYKYLECLCKKTIFLEIPRLSKEEKQDILERFKAYKESGAVLLGVSSGSFSQSIDLPGELLKGVVVVGLPLQRPDLETKELIDYYDKKYSKGWDYGYVFPAIAKCLQGAGRCIRSETDKGVVVFLDERFSWDNYLRCFPPDYGVQITRLYLDRIKEFF
jgi:DNA excision repair protein ERCC-2